MIYKSGLLTLIIVLISVFTLLAADYSIPEIEILVTISDDGIVEISESRTYVFDGSFSWADYRLPKSGFSEIRNIRVSESDQAYVNNNSEQEGTFNVSENGNSLIIKWHYSANNETRTFTITYELSDAISVGPEWTEFYWNYVGSGRDKSNDTVNLQIDLPEGVSADSLYMWSREISGNLTESISTGRFQLQAEQVSRNEAIQVRTLFPTALFNENEVSVTDPGLTLESILQEEREYMERREREAERAAFFESITPGGTLLIILISFGVFYYLYQRYGKRYKTGTISKQHTIMIPDDTPPALVGRLISWNNTAGNHLAATFFDLARRGWFTIKENKKEKTNFFSVETTEYIVSRTDSNPDEIPEEWEKKIIDFAEKRIGGGKQAYSEMFKGSDSQVYKWYSKWTKSVKSAYDSKNWIDKESYRGVYLNMGIQFILMAFAVLLFVYGTQMALIAIVFTLFMEPLSLVIIRRTQKGEEIYRRWKAYRNGLKNADKRTIRMEMLDRHFIYATALGLTKNQINTLIEESDETSTNLFPWIVLMQGSSTTPASVAESLSTLAASGSSSFGGTSGGSGASTGSAGGGATGGAG